MEVHRPFNAVPKVVRQHLHLATSDVHEILLGVERCLKKSSLIGKNPPVYRSHNIECHACLEVGLVKHWQHSIAVIWWELRVQVLLALEIYKRHQPISILIVLRSEANDSYILPDEQACPW